MTCDLAHDEMNINGYDISFEVKNTIKISRHFKLTL